MDACVSVNGRTRLMRGPGIRRKKNHWNHQVTRRGNTRSGTRQTRETKEDRQTVPKRAEKVWEAAAETTVLEDVPGGMECRWKYHCDTVAAVVALLSEFVYDSTDLCTPEKTPQVHRNINI